MSGWGIIIYALPAENVDVLSENLACYKTQQAAILAHWQVGALGTRWLSELVDQGKAHPLRLDGYPCRWQSTAGAVLPLLQTNAIEPYSENVRPLWIGPITRYPDRIAACSHEQLITIEAWDLD